MRLLFLLMLIAASSPAPAAELLVNQAQDDATPLSAQTVSGRPGEKLSFVAEIWDKDDSGNLTGENRAPNEFTWTMTCSAQPCDTSIIEDGDPVTRVVNIDLPNPMPRTIAITISHNKQGSDPDFNPATLVIQNAEAPADGSEMPGLSIGKPARTGGYYDNGTVNQQQQQQQSAAGSGGGRGQYGGGGGADYRGGNDPWHRGSREDSYGGGYGGGEDYHVAPSEPRVIQVESCGWVGGQIRCTEQIPQREMRGAVRRHLGRGRPLKHAPAPQRAKKPHPAQRKRTR